MTPIKDKIEPEPSGLRLWWWKWFMPCKFKAWCMAELAKDLVPRKSVRTSGVSCMFYGCSLVSPMHNSLVYERDVGPATIKTQNAGRYKL